MDQQLRRSIMGKSCYHCWITALILLLTILLDACSHSESSPTPTMNMTVYATNTPEYCGTDIPGGISIPFTTIIKDEDGWGQVIRDETGHEIILKEQYRSKEPSLVVITNPAEVSELDDTIFDATKEELLRLDYSKYMVIAVYRGEQPTTLESVEVKEIRVDNLEVEVRAYYQEPNYGQGAGQTLTSPFHIVRVVREQIPKGEVEFHLIGKCEMVLSVKKRL